MKRAGWLAIAVVCAAGLAAGAGVRSVFFPKQAIALVPPVIQIHEAHLQGARLDAEFEIKNHLRKPVVVKLFTSCGCMGVSGPDGLIKGPFTLPAGAVMPLSLGVDTGGSAGRQSFKMTAITQDAGHAATEASAVVYVHVLAALQAQPRMVIFHRARSGQPLAAEIQLADVLPDPGVTIREVRVSNENTMRVEVVPRDGPSAMFGDEAPGRARATLEFSYTPDAGEGRIQEMITVVPEDDAYPDVQVPVYCQMAEPPFRFVPRGLSIVDDGQERFRRNVALVADHADVEVSVIRTPRGIDVELGDASHEPRLVTISGSIADVGDDEGEIVFSVEGEELVFPIRRLAMD